MLMTTLGLAEQERDAARAEVAQLTAALDDATQEIESLREALEDATREIESLQEEIAEHLPHYVLDDGTDEPANAKETIEYVGAELKRGMVTRLTEENARLRDVVEVARRVPDAVRGTGWSLSVIDDLRAALSRLDQGGNRG